MSVRFPATPVKVLNMSKIPTLVYRSGHSFLTAWCFRFVRFDHFLSVTCPLFVFFSGRRTVSSPGSVSSPGPMHITHGRLGVSEESAFCYLCQCYKIGVIVWKQHDFTNIHNSDKIESWERAGNSYATDSMHITYSSLIVSEERTFCLMCQCYKIGAIVWK